MEKYAKELRTGGADNGEVNDAMAWGSMCEDHAIATYVSKISCKEYKKTGLWVVSYDKGRKWLGISPDGIVDGEIVVEIK